MAKKKYKSIHKPKRKMKSVHGSKTNKKLILILITSMCIIGGGLGGLLYVNMKSPASNVANADESMALGEYRKAYKLYGKAVSKDLKNSEYLKKLQVALLSITPMTREEAATFYDRYIETLIHSARYNPSDIDVQLNLVKEMSRAARVTGEANYWRRLQSVAQSGLDHIAPDNPRRHELILFLGISSLRIENATMTETYDDLGNVRFPGEAAIEDVIKADPGNGAAWAALAHGRMALYYRLDNEGKTKQAKFNFILANETMQKAVEVAGDNIDVLIAAFRDIQLQKIKLTQQHLADPMLVTQKELDTAELKVAKAQNTLAENFDPEFDGARTAEIVSLLLTATKEGHDVAIDILQKHIGEYPNDYLRRYRLSTVLRQQDRLNEAKEVMQVLIDAPQQTVSLEAIKQFDLYAPAAHFLVELATYEAMRAEDETSKQAFIDEAKSNKKLLEKFVSNNRMNNLLLYSEGLIALAEGDYKTAAVKLEKVISRTPNPSGQQLRHTSIALVETGSKGLAVKRLAKAIEVEPWYLLNYRLKALLEIQISDFKASEQTLSKLPQSARETKEVSELLDIIAMNNSVSNDTVFTDEILAVIANSEQMYLLGEREQAFKLLLGAIEKTDNKEWRLLRAISNLYMKDDKMESAIASRKEAVLLQPNSKQLKEELIVLESGGRVEAIIAIVNSQELSEGETAEKIAVGLFALAMQQRNAQIRWNRMGGKAEAAEAGAISTKAFSESSRYQAIALDLGINGSDITIMKFNQALLVKDLVAAKGFIEEYASMYSDEIELAEMKITVLLLSNEEAKTKNDIATVQNNFKKALEMALNNTEKMPFSDTPWRVLGLVHSAMGNVEEALLANSEAYAIAPKSMENIRSYIGSLLASNAEPARMLRTIRLAREQHPTDRQILEAWLDIETQYGELSDVLEHRNERYMLDSQDRKNTIDLVSFYLKEKPSYDLLLNIDGSKKYIKRTWVKLPIATQNKILREAQEAWRYTAKNLLDELAKSDNLTADVCLMHATVLRDSGRITEVSEVWEKFIESRRGTEEFTLASIAAADFFEKSDLIPQAIAVLKSAVDFQSDLFEVDSALGSIYYLHGEYSLAAESLVRPIEATQNIILQSRRIEALAFSSQFEEAEKALENFKNSNNAFSTAMHEATINRIQSSEFLAQGEIENAKKSLALYRKSLKSAIAIDPKNMSPYFRLCASLLNEYRLTQNKEMLEEALVVADEGDKIGENLEQFVIVRADVLQADGQLERAIEQLRQYIEKTPNSDSVRQRLVEAYLDTNNVNRAIAVVEEGIKNNPNSSDWFRQLGDLKFRVNNDRGGAAMAYIEAIKMKPTIALLFQLNALTRTKQVMPDFDLLAIARGDASNLHPVSKSIEAKALMNMRKVEEAHKAMEDSWKTYNISIKRGWIPPAAIVDWFVDLQLLFENNPEEGERFARRVAAGKFTPEQQYGLANYYKVYGLDHFEKTIALIDASINNPRTDKNLRGNLLNFKGTYLVEVRKFEESKEVFQQLVEEYDSALVLNNYAYVVGVYMNEPIEGLILAKQAAEKAPRNPSIIDTISVLYERIGNYEKAAEMLDYLLVIDPSNAKAMAKLSILNTEHLQDPERGVVFAERARSLSPRLPEVLDALGWSYYKTGHEDKGKDYLQRSLREGDTMSAYVHLAQVVMKHKEYDKALDYLRMAQELAEDSYSKDSITTLNDDIRSIQVVTPE